MSEVAFIDEGTYRLVTPVDWLPQMCLHIEEAARTCYRSETGPITTGSADKMIRKLIAREHESQLEHSMLTVKFPKCSRGFTHELVRHRLSSFGQESTRYVDYDADEGKIEVVPPPNLEPHEAKAFMADFMGSIDNYLSARQFGHPPEDARQLLPIGLRAPIVITANFRQWRNIFHLRTDKPAHWEIRRVMCKLLVDLKEIIPVVFEDFHKMGTDKKGVDWYIHLMPDGKLNRQIQARKKLGLPLPTAL